MEIRLIKFWGRYNEVEKRNLETVSVLEGELREECSIVHPVITIEYSSELNFNYVYIPIFKRFYFVNDITVIRNNLYEISLSVDVLQTYNQTISKLKGFVDRSADDSNRMIIDKKRVVEQGYDIEESVPIYNDVFYPYGYNDEENIDRYRYVIVGYDFDVYFEQASM